MICPHSKCECEHYKRKKTEKKYDIGFDGRKFTGLNEDNIGYLINQFPALSIANEICKMEVWLFSNPKNRKSNYMRFITNWLSKAQDKARRVDNIVSPLKETFVPDWRRPI